MISSSSFRGDALASSPGSILFDPMRLSDQRPNACPITTAKLCRLAFACARNVRAATFQCHCQRAEEDVSSHSRDAYRARVMGWTTLQIIRGRREGRVPAAPMARVQQKKHAAATTGPGGSTGLPCAMVLTVSFVLSSVTGLFCH